MAFRFDVNVVDDHAHQVVQPQRFSGKTRRVAFRARDLNQLADQHVEPVRLALDPVECGVGIAAAPRQFDGDSEPGERRPQLVRDILQQTPLRFEKALDALRHLVDGAAQLAKLIGTA